MNPEQKKEYVAPTMNVVQVRYQHHLMEISPGNDEETENFTDDTTNGEVG